MAGEWGHRKGSDFEQSFKTMLACLGFKIICENVGVQCGNPDHKTPEHSIDVLAQHIGPFPRPCESYDGLTLFDLRAREKVPEEELNRVSRTLECLRKTNSYADARGAVFVTCRGMTPKLAGDLKNYSEIKCWDINRLSLYGRMAELFPYRARCKYHSENKMRIILHHPNPYDAPPYYVTAELFYEEENRLNLDNLKRGLVALRKIMPWGSIADVRVRSLSGFTSDLPLVLTTVAKDCSSWFRRVRIAPGRLFDYTRPWFATAWSKPEP
jgi:hypothetical protein